jgi:hypothetical protein
MLIKFTQEEVAMRELTSLQEQVALDLATKQAWANGLRGVIPSEKTAPISSGKTAPVAVSGGVVGRRRAQRTVSTHGHFLR